MVARILTWNDLLARFPELSGGVCCPMRCEFPIAGKGRHPARGFGSSRPVAEIGLSARPAARLFFEFRHCWPEGASPVEAAALEEALVLGLAEGVLREEWTPMGCSMVCTDVQCSDLADVAAVRIAAARAVQDVCRQVGWIKETEDEPPLEPA